MVPNNIVLPSAQQGVNILHYKTVGDVWFFSRRRCRRIELYSRLN